MVEVQFKKHPKRAITATATRSNWKRGDIVAVEATPGHDIGVVTLTGRLVPLQMKKANFKTDVEIKRIYRKVKPVDMEKFNEAKSKGTCDHDPCPPDRTEPESEHEDW